MTWLYYHEEAVHELVGEQRNQGADRPPDDMAIQSVQLQDLRSGVQAMSVTKTADEQVLAVLRQASITDDGLRINGTLDRETYIKVNKFLEMAGAKWDRRAGMHVFQGNAKTDILAMIQSGSVTDKKQLYQAFYTPIEIATSMVELANIVPGDNVLEPSAGIGNIANVVRTVGAKVTCVEINPESAESLATLGHTVFCRDFLTCDAKEIGGPFDVVVMNPPFTKNQAFEHVLFAQKMVRENGVIVAILPNVAPRKRDLNAKWVNMLARMESCEVIEAGAFKESGTNVETRLARFRMFRM